MKLSSHLAQLKRQKQALQPASAARAQGGKVRLRRWALLALGVVLAAGGTWAVLKFFVWTELPPALVGTWEVTDGPMAGGTFTFSSDGTLAIRAGGPGANLSVNAQVVVEGKIMLTTSQDPKTGQEQTRTSIIRELSPTSFVLELEKGQVLRMARRK
jgi:hypothetical protein